MRRLRLNYEHLSREKSQEITPAGGGLDKALDLLWGKPPVMLDEGAEPSEDLALVVSNLALVWSLILRLGLALRP